MVIALKLVAAVCPLRLIAWRCLAVLVCAAAMATLDAPTGAQQLPAPVQASASSNRVGRQVSLRDQLRVGLKAVTKADFAFIDLVVLRVEQGTLPRKLVDSTFLWARNRYKSRPTNHRLRPIVYFQPALVLQTKKIGVPL